MVEIAGIIPIRSILGTSEGDHISCVCEIVRIAEFAYFGEIPADALHIAQCEVMVLFIWQLEQERDHFTVEDWIVKALPPLIAVWVFKISAADCLVPEPVQKSVT